jgi:hypothetical protein
MGELDATVRACCPSSVLVTSVTEEMPRCSTAIRNVPLAGAITWSRTGAAPLSERHCLASTGCGSSCEVQPLSAAARDAAASVITAPIFQVRGAKTRWAMNRRDMSSVLRHARRGAKVSIASGSRGPA